VKRQIMDRAVELGYRVFEFRMTDNEHLDPTYVAQVQREFVGLWRKRFVDGLWVIAAGAVFDMWDPARHVVRHEDLPKMDRVLALGLDYGDTHLTRGMLLGLGRDKAGVARLYVLAEWAPGPMTIGEHSAHLRSWMGALEPAAWRTPEWVYVDPAAGSFKHQLFYDGIVAGNASNAVLDGIRTVSSLLATDRLLISDRCTNLVDQIPAYVWDPKATARGEDKPVKKEDDEVDALRYAIFSTRVLWQNAIQLTATPTGDAT